MGWRGLASVSLDGSAMADGQNEFQLMYGSDREHLLIILFTQ